MVNLPVEKTSDQCERPRFLKNLVYFAAVSMTIPKVLEIVLDITKVKIPIDAETVL
jgi:hypothetical protein